MVKKNIWEISDNKKIKAIDKFSKEYIDFLSECKTERECVDFSVNELSKAGFVELEEAIREGRELKAGDKVYFTQMNKALAALVIGTEPIEKGLNILGAHIDSPRLDVKQNPLYEKDGFAYFDTHYYGGVKKYQWVTIPLAIHGVVVKKSGEVMEINLGEDKDDPVFFISDLLIHLSAEQLEKKASKVIEGESLDLVIGNMPLKADNKEDKEGSEAVKNNILDILKNYYDIEEEDFLSAELEIVPAGAAREAGLDRSMILGYGHDDRVCAYPSLRAILDNGTPKRTSCVLLVDKEEIGSVGATGMKSEFFVNGLAEIMNLAGEYSELKLRRALGRSVMLSSDVSAGYDPLYADKYEKNNSCFLGKGMVFNKYTGSRGKSGSNDANAEFFASIRNILDEAEIVYQTCELGKVDAGGGGTIAYIMARYGMNVIDCGVGVINMHAPHEAVNKADLYEAYIGYKVFLERAEAV